MKKRPTIGRKVTVSASALKRAKEEYGTSAPAGGKVVEGNIGDGLVTVLHTDGQKVDWHFRSLTVIE